MLRTKLTMVALTSLLIVPVVFGSDPCPVICKRGGNLKAECSAYVHKQKPCEGSDIHQPSKSEPIQDAEVEKEAEKLIEEMGEKSFDHGTPA
jgi:hypothetical protein